MFTTLLSLAQAKKRIFIGIGGVYVITLGCWTLRMKSMKCAMCFVATVRRTYDDNSKQTRKITSRWLLTWLKMIGYQFTSESKLKYTNTNRRKNIKKTANVHSIVAKSWIVTAIKMCNAKCLTIGRMRHQIAMLAQRIAINIQRIGRNKWLNCMKSFSQSVSHKMIFSHFGYKIRSQILKPKKTTHTHKHFAKRCEEEIWRKKERGERVRYIHCNEPNKNK